MVGINIPIPVPMAFHSGDGKDHYLEINICMALKVKVYTKLKTITSRWPSGLTSTIICYANFKITLIRNEKSALIGAGQIGGTLAHLIH